MNFLKGDKAKFNDHISVTKAYQQSVMIEGKEVPINHEWGSKGYKTYPKARVNLAKAIANFNSKVFGAINPFEEKFFGTEYLRIEKYKEVYHAGIGNDAVFKLSQKGYNYRQIAAKIGKPVVKSIDIAHAIKGWKPGFLNLMLDEGVDIIWDLINESNAVDYYTNALARMGVGNSTTAAAKTDTGLIGGSTVFLAMVATYPLSTTAQRVDFKGSAADGIGEFAWEEFSVDNGTTPNDNLQRLVSAKGTKSTGEVWTAEVQITGS